MYEELDIHCVIESDSGDGSNSSSDSSDEDRLVNLERDTLTWLRYCRMVGSLVRQYIESSRARIRCFLNVRNGRVFMIAVLEEDPNIAFCQVDMAFETVEEVVDVAKIDLPDEQEEIAATTFAPHVRNTEWDQLRDHIA
ncbi:hypothetical protein Adt_32386 [Abeliophyllum distichum]|uniref:Uncharacterized protein n=1 Tax=Abeliophyllum distichum TaxID=126358 RepID=A0ABD1QT84_9LAMI